MDAWLDNLPGLKVEETSGRTRRRVLDRHVAYGHVRAKFSQHGYKLHLWDGGYLAAHTHVDPPLTPHPAQATRMQTSCTIAHGMGQGG